LFQRISKLQNWFSFHFAKVPSHHLSFFIDLSEVKDFDFRNISYVVNMRITPFCITVHSSKFNGTIIFICCLCKLFWEFLRLSSIFSIYFNNPYFTGFKYIIRKLLFIYFNHFICQNSIEYHKNAE
jgi:hypothetical protein